MKSKLFYLLFLSISFYGFSQNSIKNGVVLGKVFDKTLGKPIPYVNVSILDNNKIVTGTAYLTIEKVPTPLLIPFGFFPNKKGRASGIIFPSFGESAERGFYFQHLGYYFG